MVPNVPPIDARAENLFCSFWGDHLKSQFFSGQYYSLDLDIVTLMGNGKSVIITDCNIISGDFTVVKAIFELINVS